MGRKLPVASDALRHCASGTSAEGVLCVAEAWCRSIGSRRNDPCKVSPHLDAKRACRVNLPLSRHRSARFHRNRPRGWPRPTDFVWAGQEVGSVQPISFELAKRLAASSRFHLSWPRGWPRPADSIGTGRRVVEILGILWGKQNTCRTGIDRHYRLYRIRADTYVEF